MLNYNNSTEFLRVFNRNNLSDITSLELLITGKPVIKCSVISITPRYIYFNPKQLGILQTGNYEYILTTIDSIEIDRGILNIQVSNKSLIQTENKIINYGTKQ